MFLASVAADANNGINLPKSGSFLGVEGNETENAVISSSLISQANNPFVGTNSSDNSSLTINSAVLMLSLTNETGYPLDMS